MAPSRDSTDARQEQRSTGLEGQTESAPSVQAGPATAPRVVRSARDVGSILALQRSAGNAAVAAVLARGGGATDATDAPAPAQSSGSGPVCEHPVPDVPLFDAIEKTWPLFGESTEVEVWRATVDLGWLGSLDLALRAGASAEASLLAGLGPGVLRNICLGGDPEQACVTGSG